LRRLGERLRKLTKLNADRMKTTTRIALPKPKHKKPFNKKEFVKQANDVRKILEKEKNTGTGAYDVTKRAGKKRFREMLRGLVE